MKATDVVAYAEDGAIYCPNCANESESMEPVFADSEWDSFPTCDACGEKIKEVSLTRGGVAYELEQLNFEWFHVTETETETGDVFHDEVDGEYLGDGWYGWFCLPGCLPDSEPYGPYETEQELIDDRSMDLW